MGYYVVQGGNTLYRISATGTVAALTLPAGTVVSAVLQLRPAILGRLVVLTHSPSQNIALDPLGRLRPLTVGPPATPVALAASGVGLLSGIYRVKQTHLIKDEDGQVVSESDFGPASAASATLALNQLQVTGINRSSSAFVNCRRLYRTASGGSTYFQWIDIEGNSVTSLIDGISDEGLSTLAAPTDLGAPPSRLELITSWKDRLWARGSALTDIDTVYYSGSRKPWGWPVANAFSIPPAGKDEVGITGFIARRDELAVGRQDIIHKIIGRTPANFERVQLVDVTGILAPDSVQVIHDTGYWLGGDGVYQWGPKGVECVSAPVAGWFQSDRYFARSQFPNAIGHFNEKHNLYQLLLSAVGSTVLDRWVALEIDTGRWHGPHKTAAFTPTHAGEIEDTNGLTVPILGSSSGFVFVMNQAAYADDGSAIDFDVKLRHTANTPDIEKVFLEATVHTRPESGGTLDVIPQLGNENAAAQATISRDLLLDRQRVRRLSTATNPTGRMLTLRFRNNELNRGVQLRGYECPFFEEGRR